MKKKPFGQITQPFTDLGYYFWNILHAQKQTTEKYGVNEEIPDGILAQLKHPLATFRNPLWYLLHPVNSIKKNSFFLLKFYYVLCGSPFEEKEETKPWDIYSSESSLDY